MQTDTEIGAMQPVEDYTSDAEGGWCRDPLPSHLLQG